ncbi:DUF5685 family protein [Tepidibacter aestuarii]|uniref:DUF5685 family protein n=1 Tax=Tepidibacter aestuarii TaxID=2925782 RepID=UPI0020BF99B7|nr:DUF5685 family protein [Tepidibacter aestuarii]CAH2211985.1 conserved protein of unknown function [Tepidibacter aestuarii]
MFGYVRINKMELKIKEYYKYRGYYCGLCKYLKENFGEISRLSLNYDVTFLITLLSSIYKSENSITKERCLVKPMNKNLRIVNDITEYGANMNIILTHNKLKDNIDDDKRIKDYLLFYMHKSVYKKINNTYRQKSEFIQNKLKELSELEKDNTMNIDKTSNIFGDIMREVFHYKDDEYTYILGNIGFNIGKYIYILDAYEDLDDDFKLGRYNPFMNYIDNKEELKNKVENIILLILSFIEEDIMKLELSDNKGIVENIIYSGMYLRFTNIMKGRDNDEKSI